MFNFAFRKDPGEYGDRQRERDLGRAAKALARLQVLRRASSSPRLTPILDAARDYAAFCGHRLAQLESIPEQPVLTSDQAAALLAPLKRQAIRFRAAAEGAPTPTDETAAERTARLRIERAVLRLPEQIHRDLANPDLDGRFKNLRALSIPELGPMVDAIGSRIGIAPVATPATEEARRRNRLLLDSLADLDAQLGRPNGPTTVALLHRHREANEAELRTNLGTLAGEPTEPDWPVSLAEASPEQLRRSLQDVYGRLGRDDLTAEESATYTRFRDDLLAALRLRSELGALATIGEIADFGLTQHPDPAREAELREAKAAAAAQIEAHTDAIARLSAESKRPEERPDPNRPPSEPDHPDPGAGPTRPVKGTEPADHGREEPQASLERWLDRRAELDRALNAEPDARQKRVYRALQAIVDEAIREDILEDLRSHPPGGARSTDPDDPGGPAAPPPHPRPRPSGPAGGGERSDREAPSPEPAPHHPESTSVPEPGKRSDVEPPPEAMVTRGRRGPAQRRGLPQPEEADPAGPSGPAAPWAAVDASTAAGATGAAERPATPAARPERQPAPEPPRSNAQARRPGRCPPGVGSIDR